LGGQDGQDDSNTASPRPAAKSSEKLKGEGKDSKEKDNKDKTRSRTNTVTSRTTKDYDKLKKELIGAKNALKQAEEEKKGLQEQLKRERHVVDENKLNSEKMNLQLQEAKAKTESEKQFLEKKLKDIEGRFQQTMRIVSESKHSRKGGSIRFSLKL